MSSQQTAAAGDAALPLSRWRRLARRRPAKPLLGDLPANWRRDRHRASDVVVSGTAQADATFRLSVSLVLYGPVFTDVSIDSGLRVYALTLR